MINFKEIPEAHIASGEQDTFELFARDFFEYMGYKILTPPGRGADGGADIIIEETRKGIAGETKVKWLVSCKHKAHSGNSVTLQDEKDIRDRVESKGCTGFIGFYSTLPASSLTQKIEGLIVIEHQVFDRAKIEGILLSKKAGVELAKRYFPISIASWANENPTPAQLFAETNGLKCKYCGAELLDDRKGIVVVWKAISGKHISRIYWCCKGNCDRQLQRQYHHPDYVDHWKDIAELCIPTVYAQWIMGLLNRLYTGEPTYSEEAFETFKDLLLEIFPYIARELTAEEKESLGSLCQLPNFMGGLGG